MHRSQCRDSRSRALRCPSNSPIVRKGVVGLHGRSGDARGTHAVDVAFRDDALVDRTDAASDHPHATKS
jgi:hypothetical protein